MAPLMTISADGSGAFAILNHFERVAGVELRALASRTGASIRDAAKAHAPVSSPDEGFPGHYKDWIVSKDDKDATRVYADIPAGAFTSLDLALEFGTSKMSARPHFWPAAHAAAPRFNADAASILQRVADAASKG